ncbi:pre-mrna branch site protein p14 [Phaffia rhodozyma]|uniref:Pre-mrna branch site protein p14 n=1 Tax=Phaffia rhodozyma TaxID=264483 RepID=A0A0F7SJC5_PHARH|nr:pre-mrna branch site protein p14 [Phaffia rhodozyma]
MSHGHNQSIIFVKNLNFNTTGEDLYELFGSYGPIRQVRIGNGQKTKGTAYVVFEDYQDAKSAMEKVNGFHLQDRYIVLLYHQPSRQAASATKADIRAREEAVAAEKKRLGLDD